MQAVNFSVITNELRFDWVNLNSNTVAFESKLDDIAANATECIHDIDFKVLLFQFIITLE